MNEVRKRIFSSITKYPNFTEHKDLIAFCVHAEKFSNYEDEENGIEPDFDEVIAIVEKEWLFHYMQVANPLEFLKNEYISDESIDWFDEALRQHKLVAVSFN